MKIKVRFEAQLRQAAGTDETTIEIPETATVMDAFLTAAESGAEDLSSRLVDSNCQPIRSLLVFLNDQPIPSGEFSETQLNEQDVVSILPPIAGG